MSFCTVAVDVGFGKTKWAVRRNMQIVTGSFPSLAPTASPTTVSTGEGNFGSRNTVKVEIDGTTFEVGEDVALAMGASNSGRSLSEDFPLTKNYRALLYAALYYADVRDVDVLALGLPVNTMSLYADNLKAMFDKPIVVGDRTITIKRTIVIPQPVGTLAMYGAQNPLAVSKGNLVLVIDPGYVTTDWVVASGYNMIDARSGGRSGGVSNILQDIADKITKKYGGSKIDRIERIDEAFVRNMPFSYFKHQIGQEELMNMLHLSQQTIEETVKAIKRSVGTEDDIKNIVLTGGGARFYDPVIRATFPMTNVTVLREPAMTNVVGFLVVSETFRRQAPAYEAH